jgi:hypothetical protein
MSIIYTFKERTVKNKTVQMAVTAALALLKDKGETQVCTDMVQKRDRDEAITVVEMNDLVEELVNDSLYHSGKWFGTN